MKTSCNIRQAQYVHLGRLIGMAWEGKEAIRLYTDEAYVPLKSLIDQYCPPSEEVNEVLIDGGTVSVRGDVCIAFAAVDELRVETDTKKFLVVYKEKLDPDDQTVKYDERFDPDWMRSVRKRDIIRRKK